MSYMNPYTSIPNSESFLVEATTVINRNKIEFESYFRDNSKLQAVKFLKDLTGGGLKECKEVCDLYWAGKLKPNIREERKEKLEKLAKRPLVEELIGKLKNIEEEKLNSLLMGLSVDELLSIDEFFEKSNC